MTKYTGKNNFPQRRSSVYTESGKPFLAALAHILWKWLELAVGEAGCAETQRLFEALKTDLYKSAVYWEHVENRLSPHPPTPKLQLVSLLPLNVKIIYIKFPEIKGRTVKHILTIFGNKHLTPEGAWWSSFKQWLEIPKPKVTHVQQWQETIPIFISTTGRTIAFFLQARFLLGFLL